MEQLTEDFEARFRAGDTPWEDAVPWPGLVQLFARFVAPTSRVLDLGCGLGTNALALAELGHEVLGVDISPTAIAQAQAKRDAAGIACAFRVADFLTNDCSVHDVVFDRGCLHGFACTAARRRLADAVHGALAPGGLWIDISGSADTGDPPDRIRQYGLPRLTLLDLAEAVEPRFEAVEISQGRYGTNADTDFRAWIAVLRRRGPTEGQDRSNG